jgi:hypothetical protein
MFGFGGGGFNRGGPVQGEDIMHQIAVSLEDLYKGKTSKLAVTRNIICSKCSGYGFLFSPLLVRQLNFMMTTKKSFILHFMISFDLKSSH